MKRKAKKRWKHVSTLKDDVLILKLVAILREADYWGHRRTLIRKALQFIGETPPQSYEKDATT